MKFLNFIRQRLNLSNKAFGDIGEDIAESFLREKGYRIITRNFRCRQGEIDIIAADKDKKVIVFIEVKTRSSDLFGLPEEAVTPAKQRRITKAASYYQLKHKSPAYSYRADIVAILQASAKEPEITHIINAFPLAR